MDDERAGGPVRWTLAVLLTGVVAGLGGAALTLLLAGVEVLWFGRSHAPGPEAAVLAPAPIRTVAVIAAGCATAVGWWLLRRRDAPPSVAQAVAGRRMRVPGTLLNAALQIVNVGSGASIGREAAPREVGALGGQRAAGLLGLSDRQRRILAAAGAGAGLAAIYDVPLSGVLFALEVLLAPAVAGAVLPAIGVVVVAVAVAHAVGVPAGPLYHLPVEPWGPWLVVLALVLGPLLGTAGALFGQLVDRLVALGRRRRWLVLVLLPLASVATAAVALGLPDVLGNGQAISLQALGGGLGTAGLGAALLLAVAKAATTAATLGSGAAGGRLNPSFAIGAAAGAGAGGAVTTVLPGVPPGGGALVGAAAFLAAAQRSPLTAAALAVEFTDTGVRLLLPVLVAVAGASAAAALLDRLRVLRPPGAQRVAED